MAISVPVKALANEVRETMHNEKKVLFPINYRWYTRYISYRGVDFCF